MKISKQTRDYLYRYYKENNKPLKYKMSEYERYNLYLCIILCLMCSLIPILILFLIISNSL